MVNDFCPTREKSKKVIDVRVVSTDEERRMVAAVRSAVHLGESEGRYQDHFDGNDYCSTLLLALEDGEPIGTMRCRWYAEFARFEKLAVRKPWRRLVILNAIVAAAARLSRQKGYSKVSGMALPEVVSFWVRKGGLTPGESFETTYGTVVPLAGPLPDVPGIDPVRYELAGQKEWECRVYDWEGNLL